MVAKDVVPFHGGTSGSNPASSSKQSVSRGISSSCIEKPAVAAACAGPARRHGRHCGTGKGPDRDITGSWRDVEEPARLCRPCRLAGPAHTAETAGLSIQEGEIYRETDCLLEGYGFEPSVPQREGTGLFRDHLDRPPAPSPSREAAYLDSGTFTTFEPGIFARYGTGVRTRIWKNPWRSSGPSWLS